MGQQRRHSPVWRALAATAALGIVRTSGEGCTPEVLRRYPSGWPGMLDYGIYWFGPSGEFAKAGTGAAAQLYNPSRKTMIYFHGWLGGNGGSLSKCFRPAAQCDEEMCEGQRLPLFDAWHQQGWNVGYFYWDQFADEPCSRDAEQKILFTRGNQGIRWASIDPSTYQKKYHTIPGKETSVAGLCSDSIGQSLAMLTSREVRFVGHDIGAQLAVHCGFRLYAANSPGRPSRVAILDPVFTERHLRIFRCHSLSLGPSVGDYASQAMEQAVRALRTAGVPTVLLKTSLYSESNVVGKADRALDDLCLQVKYEPEWCNAKHNQVISFQKNWMCKHNAAMVEYFLSAKDPPPALEGSQASHGGQSCLVPSPICTDRELVNLLRTQRDSIETSQQNVLWHQSKGRSSVNTADDTFTVESKSMSAAAAKAAAVGPSSRDLVPTSTSLLPPATMPSAPMPAAPVPVPAAPTRAPAVETVARGVPTWQKALSVALGIAGIAMLIYGLTPLVVYCCRCCCGKHDERHVQMSDNSEDSDFE